MSERVQQADGQHDFDAVGGNDSESSRLKNYVAINFGPEVFAELLARHDSEPISSGDTSLEAGRR